MINDYVRRNEITVWDCYNELPGHSSTAAERKHNSNNNYYIWTVSNHVYSARDFVNFTGSG